MKHIVVAHNFDTAKVVSEYCVANELAFNFDKQRNGEWAFSIFTDDDTWRNIAEDLNGDPDIKLFLDL